MTTATSYAHAVAAGEQPLSWAELEENAFSSHPSIVGDLRASGEELSVRPTSAARSVPAAIGVLLLEIWPLIAGGLIITPVRLDADPTVPVIIAGIGAIVYIASRIALWVQVGRGRGDVSARRAILNAIAAAFGLGAVWLISFIVAGLPAGSFWLLVMIVMAVSSAVTAVVFTVRLRRHPDAGTKDGTGFARVRASVSALSEQERAAIRRDLDDAIAVLASAGLLSPSEADDAGGAPLGGLARYQWAVERSQSKR
ncbi:MAG: hypothetical protein ABWX82_13230 [Leifsonia sp.]